MTLVDKIKVRSVYSTYTFTNSFYKMPCRPFSIMIGIKTNLHTRSIFDYFQKLFRSITQTSSRQIFDAQLCSYLIRIFFQISDRPGSVSYSLCPNTVSNRLGTRMQYQTFRLKLSALSNHLRHKIYIFFPFLFIENRYIQRAGKRKMYRPDFDTGTINFCFHIPNTRNDLICRNASITLVKCNFHIL